MNWFEFLVVAVMLPYPIIQSWRLSESIFRD